MSNDSIEQLDRGASMTEELHRLTAFSTDSEGGNPAGVWIGNELPDPDTMQAIAKQVGYSETAFLAPKTGKRRTVRYYSPEAEVPFCGHVTIASGVVLGNAEGDGTYLLDSIVGEIPVEASSKNGIKQASLTSVEPKYEQPSEQLLKQVLATLNWQTDELDNSIPPALAYAGAWHFVIAAGSKQRLDQLDYDFDQLKSLMLENDLTTIQLVWRENQTLFHSRNPFPVGGVVEDPATGAAAAALGGYLRESGLLQVPATVNIRQGEVMGRPSQIDVDIPLQGGITVTGAAVKLS